MEKVNQRFDVWIIVLEGKELRINRNKGVYRVCV